ncbi:hypothetical protein GH733_007720 [Mirounga leonina]|nr:hypothetical protein GH733_007720 [Mirounga leonina]
MEPLCRVMGALSAGVMKILYRGPLRYGHSRPPRARGSAGAGRRALSPVTRRINSGGSSGPPTRRGSPAASLPPRGPEAPSDARRLRPPPRLAAPRRGPFGHPGARVADAIDNHRSFQEKPGLTGKRELPPEDEARPGGFARPLSEKAALRMIIEFLTFLHLKEAGALEYMPELPAAVSAEDQEQA